MRRFTLHVYSIFHRKGWHYSNAFFEFSNLIIFFKYYKMQHFDDRVKHRLYRVHDSLDNHDTFFIVDFEKLPYKLNKYKVIDRSEAEAYIKEINE